jgi:DNA/RNA-binding domain of Phe-tRNA-synthetase-like protein
MKKLPFDISMELEGWRLFWARLEIEQEADAELAALRGKVAASAGQRFGDTSKIGAHPTVAALRRLFRAAGCDPTRYRPASEALLRRLVKGSPLPAIHPLVDLNNCLSAELAVPCCVMVEGIFGTSLTWRAGREGESYESLRGPFNLEKKPLLLDEEGALDTPITGSQRVKVVSGTTSAWLVAYMPASELSLDQAWAVLDELRSTVGIAAEPFEQGA